MWRLLKRPSFFGHLALQLSSFSHSGSCSRSSPTSSQGHHLDAPTPEPTTPVFNSGQLVKAPKDMDCSGGAGGHRQMPQNPMELLSSVFQQHPAALRLHRELTIALSQGDSTRAADLATVLANAVQRFAGARGSEAAGVGAAPVVSKMAESAPPSDIPPAGLEDVQEAVEKTRQELSHQAALQMRNMTSSEEGAGRPWSASVVAKETNPFWRDPEQLCITVLESAFETEVLSGESQDTLTPTGNVAAAHEAEQVRILDSYLEKEAERWRAQKAAVAKIILDVTRSLGLTPEDLQAAEGIFSSPCANSAATRRGEQRLNVLRHTNIVIRGEIPSSSLPSSPSEDVSEGVEVELQALEERMSSLGQPLTPFEVRMARFELQMNKSKMRYVVGVHKELQVALDNSAALRKLLQERSTPEVTLSSGTEVFMSEVIRALNEGATAYTLNITTAGEELSVSNVKAREAAESPVLPFTFMLKCSLWFTTPPASCFG